MITKLGTRERCVMQTLTCFMVAPILFPLLSRSELPKCAQVDKNKIDVCM